MCSIVHHVAANVYQDASQASATLRYFRDANHWLARALLYTKHQVAPTRCVVGRVSLPTFDMGQCPIPQLDSACNGVLHPTKGYNDR